jgi:hypothetical protein
MSDRGPQVRRSGSQVRRTQTKRQSTAPSLSSVQIIAIVLMTACVSGIFAITGSPSFAIRTLEIHGATFTSESVIRSILGMDGKPNAFRIETDTAESELVQLPAVEAARVQVRLPSTVVVTLVERQPKLVWVIGDRRYVVDQEGVLFGLVDSAGNPIPSTVGPLATPNSSASPAATDSSGASASTGSSSPSAGLSSGPTPKPKKTKKPKATRTPTPSPSPSPSASSGSSSAPSYNPSLLPSLAPAPTADPSASSGPAAMGLPVVFDRRTAEAGLGLGGVIDPVSLDAGYRLAGLTPKQVGSNGPSLTVVIDDNYGFTVSSVPAGWVAQFGFYAPTVRETTIIPEQVRDLRSLLARYGETHVAWVWLVSDVSNNHYNTYMPR